MSNLTFKKKINRKFSTIEENTISSSNKLVKSRKSNSIDNNEFIPYYKSYLKNNLKLNTSLIIKKKEYNIPFCYEEKRFKWQNLPYNKNQFDFFEYKNQKKRIYIKGNLNEGLIKFLSKNENKGNLNKSIDSIHLNNNNKNYGLNSIRVILPEKNFDKKDYELINHKKKFHKDNSNLYHSSKGSMDSLFERTEIIPPKRGRKKIEIKSINLFSNDNKIIGEPKKNYRMSYHRNYFDHISSSFSSKIPRSVSVKNNLNYYINKNHKFNDIQKKYKLMNLNYL